MALRDIQKSYIFPRIPLRLELPENYPDIGNISNVSVVPEIKVYRYSREGLEIKGSYQIIVSYFSALPNEDEEVTEFRELEEDDFFSHLKLQADGLFAETDDTGTGGEAGFPELYTVHFSRAFHTFVEPETVNGFVNFKPGMVVEKINLNDSEEGRLLKGELVFGLVNMPKKRMR
ncbi:MAG: hypothetical protein CVU89_09185 [Firmicutes bacterium HGW-Firmicutes-14]|nr:MAG: hypothetical protein CVU89_09185 [Firmicutes bacterium HGW-Firmicutes-14]